MAGIFLDNAAGAGSSPSRLMCQDYTLLLHKTAEPVQTSRLVLMWAKMGVFTASPSPDPFTMTVSTNFPPEFAAFSASLSLSKIRGLEVSCTSVTFFCELPASYL